MIRKLRILIEKIRIYFILKKHFIDKYKINDDLTVDVDGNVSIVNCDKCPVKFGEVTGFFSIKNVSTMDGFPYYVGGVLFINSCFLTTLKGIPKTVIDSIHMHDNKLTWLDYLPDDFDGSIVCDRIVETDESIDSFNSYLIGRDTKILTNIAEYSKKINTFRNREKLINKINLL